MKTIMNEPKTLTGTCGYDYLDWRETFYPTGLAREEFLPYYASQFSAVEINNSYYQMPQASRLLAMADRAGPAMQFSVKANDSLTHKVDPSLWRDNAKLFRAAIDPLMGRGKLAALLFQFPSSFHYQALNRTYLDQLLKEFQDYPVAVEFRHSEWVNRRVLDALRLRNVAWTCTDLPDLPKLPQPADIVTAPLAYVRFHGRNAMAFWGSDAASRYDYLYGEAELRPWVDRIRAMERLADRVLVFFNNHRYGQAASNARMLLALLAASRQSGAVHA